MLQYTKKACKSVFHKLGYEISAIDQTPPDRDFQAATLLDDARLYHQFVGPCPTFSPWLGHPDFQVIYEGADRHTIVSPDRCYMLISLARHATHLPGHFAECGVYTGGTALMLARLLNNETGRHLYLFDSFQGLPKATREEERWFAEGEFRFDSVDKIKELLDGFGSVFIRPGWIPETFKGLEDRRFAFAHLDVDLYQSTLDCCRFFYPRMLPGGVMLFDEYGFAPARGERDAVDEFFADKRERPISLPTGQAFVMKLPE
jgi:O-methyltransferase